MLRRASAVVFLLVLFPATVSAFDHHHHSRSHHRSGGDGCGSSSSGSASSSSSSSGSASDPVLPPVASGHEIVFVSSTLYSGAIGSLHAADAQCQASASAGGHTGVFHAWLSDATGSAYDRVLDVGPWYNTSDKVVFASKSDLRGAPAAALLDEYGDPLSAAGAWTGTSATGEASGHDCEGWTNAGAEVLATTGTARDGDRAWGGGAATSACNGTASLICFQQP